MKLLFVTPQPPFPADQGTKLRTGGLVRIAAEAGHEVDLLTFGEPGPQRWCRRVVALPLPPRRHYAARVRDVALSGWPDLLLRLWSPPFFRASQRLLGENGYDVVQVEGLELARYLPAVRGVPTVFDDHNVEYVLQRRAFETERAQPRRAHAALYSLIQWRRLRRWEARVCAAAEAVLAASEHDAGLLRSLSGREVEAVPNGIDLAAIPFTLPGDQIRPNLLFDGTMSFRPNDDAATWLVRTILPGVRRQRPEVRCWVVGRDPSPRLVAANFGPNGAAVTGTVPSVEPYWERAGLYVLPMRIGGGVRFKALEAMARGLPLVSTALGVEGTAARAGRDYLRAERPDDFAAAILRLLDDAPLRRRLALSARETVSAYDWARIGPRLLGVYDRLASRPRAPV